MKGAATGRCARKASAPSLDRGERFQTNLGPIDAVDDARLSDTRDAVIFSYSRLVAAIRGAASTSVNSISVRQLGYVWRRRESCALGRINIPDVGIEVDSMRTRCHQPLVFKRWDIVVTIHAALEFNLKSRTIFIITYRNQIGRIYGLALHLLFSFLSVLPFWILRAPRAAKIHVVFFYCRLGPRLRNFWIFAAWPGIFRRQCYAATNW